MLHTSHLHREVVKDTWKSKAAVADLCPSQDFKGQCHKNPFGFMGEDMFIKAHLKSYCRLKALHFPLGYKAPNKFTWEHQELERTKQQQQLFAAVMTLRVKGSRSELVHSLPWP